VRHIAVVGASLAGINAVESLREHGFKDEITLIDAEHYLPCDKPPLSKAALAGELDYDETLLRPSDWYQEQGVTLVLGSRVVALDGPGRSLAFDDGRTLGFDGLVIAAGSAARPLPVPCSERERVHVLRTLADSRRLREELVPGRHLVIIGAGFIGLEVAATARRLGLDVTVVETEKAPLSRVFGPEVGSWVKRLHERAGINVRCAVALEEVRSASDGFRLLFRDGPAVFADVVLAGVGAAPATSWLSGSGVVVENGVRCGPDLSTDVPGVVAAGDIARWHNSLFSEEMRIEHWTNAVEQGRHAAGTLLGAAEPFQTVPYFWTDQHEAKIRFVGRADSADDIAVAEPRENSLVALFGRGGVLRGAVCVNLPRRLAQYRAAIAEHMPWEDAVKELGLHPKTIGRSIPEPLRPGTTGGSTK
jgi:NADPH-dependent 2,4-dienoyl-CoA reductase/sulfur reductase-like enzyme